MEKDKDEPGKGMAWDRCMLHPEFPNCWIVGGVGGPGQERPYNTVVEKMAKDYDINFTISDLYEDGHLFYEYGYEGKDFAAGKERKYIYEENEFGRRIDDPTPVETMKPDEPVVKRKDYKKENDYRPKEKSKDVEQVKY